MLLQIISVKTHCFHQKILSLHYQFKRSLGRCRIKNRKETRSFPTRNPFILYSSLFYWLSERYKILKSFAWVSSTSGQQYNHLTKWSSRSLIALSPNSSIFSLLSGRCLLSSSLEVLVSYGLLPPNYRLVPANHSLIPAYDSLVGANEKLIS